MTGSDCPAPRANAGDRSYSNQRTIVHSTQLTDAKADFAVAYVMSRYRLTPAVARVVAELAALGRVFG